jgi:hypothetical protein
MYKKAAIYQYLPKAFAIATLASMATIGITTMPRPSSEHISRNVTVELFSCIEKAGRLNDGRPDSILPENVLK